jgi:hypothetical protein
LYARTAGAFTDDSEHVGSLIAAHAAVAYADGAFAILVTFSRVSHLKLHDVARRLTQRR